MFDEQVMFAWIYSRNIGREEVEEHSNKVVLCLNFDKAEIKWQRSPAQPCRRVTTSLGEPGTTISQQWNHPGFQSQLALRRLPSPCRAKASLCNCLLT